jgi:hypothetical protein
MISRNGPDTSRTEFSKPPLGNGYPFLVNVRVRGVQGAKNGVYHDDALFHWECGGLLNDVLCAVHKIPPPTLT